MRWILFALVALCLIASLAQAEDFKDPVFDLNAITSMPLNAKVLKGPYEKDGVMVEEVQFHSEMDGSTSVDIFGIFAYPKGAKALPAFIWNQGGLAQASDYFPILGAKRGYAALCIDFPIKGYRSTGGYLINSGLSSANDPRTAPIYHGAVAMLKAVSYLESRPEVDRNKIGMCGSSWGGFYTTLMVGIDPRLKVGSAMFGCGFLDLGNAWWGYPGKQGFPSQEAVKQWMATLDPGPRLAHRKTPIGWFTGTADMFYWMPSVMKSYAAAAGPKHLTLFPNWAHGLPSEGDEQVFVFLDIYLKGAPAFCEVSPIKIEERDGGQVATWTFTGTRKVVSADLILSPGDEGNWLSRYWLTLPAQIEGNTASVVLPPSSRPYLISGAVVDSDHFRSSTPILRIVKPPSGGELTYNGASMWGDFEEDGVDWSRRHAFMNIVPSTDAKAGKQSYKLSTGKNRLYPLYFAADQTHRFTAWVKSDKPCAITLRFDGGLPADNHKTFSVTDQWAQIECEIKTMNIPTATLEAQIEVPDGATVLIDDVKLEPVSEGVR